MCQTNLCHWSVILALALALHLPVAAGEVAPGMLTIERFSAERGDANSQFFMGQRYEEGDGGVPQDLHRALQWYRRAAEQGHGPAQYKLGEFHERGLGGLSPQPELARKWYRKAAENGSKLARDWFAEKERAAQELEEQEKKAEAERRRKAELERGRQRQAALERQRRQRAAAAAPKKDSVRARPLTPDQLLEHVAAGQWHERARPAEFLPAGDMHCLQSGKRQVTCFSEERKRTVSNASLTFSVKAILEDFSADATFNVRYVYNVLGKDTASVDAGRDPYGLGLTSGWQQPGLSAKCRLLKMSHLQCEGAGFGIREFLAN